MMPASNQAQARRLVVTCQYVDWLLGELEQAFVEAQAELSLGRYATDFSRPPSGGSYTTTSRGCEPSWSVCSKARACRRRHA